MAIVKLAKIPQVRRKPRCESNAFNYIKKDTFERATVTTLFQRWSTHARGVQHTLPYSNPRTIHACDHDPYLTAPAKSRSWVFKPTGLGVKGFGAQARIVNCLESFGGYHEASNNRFTRVLHTRTPHLDQRCLKLSPEHPYPGEHGHNKTRRPHSDRSLDSNLMKTNTP